MSAPPTDLVVRKTVDGGGARRARLRRLHRGPRHLVAAGDPPHRQPAGGRRASWSRAAGGRVYERAADGTECDWGFVRASGSRRAGWWSAGTCRTTGASTRTRPGHRVRGALHRRGRGPHPGGARAPRLRALGRARRRDAGHVPQAGRVARGARPVRGGRGGGAQLARGVREQPQRPGRIGGPEVRASGPRRPDLEHHQRALHELHPAAPRSSAATSPRSGWWPHTMTRAASGTTPSAPAQLLEPHARHEPLVGQQVAADRVAHDAGRLAAPGQRAGQDDLGAAGPGWPCPTRPSACARRRRG